MDHFTELALSAFPIALLLGIRFTLPLLATAAMLTMFGLDRKWHSLSAHGRRLSVSALAQGMMSVFVLICGACEYHITPTAGVSEAAIRLAIGIPLLLQVPIAVVCARWCGPAWPLSLATGLCWGAYSLGAGFMASCAMSGAWL